MQTQYRRRSGAAISMPATKDDVVASFGGADLVHGQDGNWELRGGSPADHAAAREWASLFQHDAVFASSPLPDAARQKSQSIGTHNRILIADDDVSVRSSLAAVLESEGFVVDEAQNGIEAVTRTVAQKPDLVLLDLNMPQCDGWAAFSQLERVAPLLPVIVITARPNQYKDAVRLGVDAFMEKPLDIPILMCAIRQLLTEDRKHYERRVTDRGFITWLLYGSQRDS